MFLYVLINRRSFWIVRSAVSGSRLDALYSRWRHSAIINDMRRILLFLLLSLSVMPLQADELDDAVRLLWSGKIDQGMSAVRSLAEKGNVKAQLFVGHAYAHENPTVKLVDYSEAIKWFKRASGQGSGEGSAAIAELYEQGLGVTKSSEEAKAWWELAAEQGYDQQEL